MLNHPYPMLLEPRFDAKIWGGRRLETVLGKSLPDEDLYGESLESDGDSRILNGLFAGKTINELLQIDAHSVLGERGRAASGEFGDFPLLAKFIDASDVLSVQVHPNDDEARLIGKRGKTEAWHIIRAERDATLITGLKPGVSTEDIARAIGDVRLGDLVIEQSVSDGDTLLIPAGTTHAIGPGILLYEIQQASDVTYRMYDWGRLDPSGFPRDLHVNESLQVVRPELLADRIASLWIGPGRSMLAACRYFALERWELPIEPETIRLDGGTFRLLSAVRGNVRIEADGASIDLATGRTALIPAAAPSLTITGDGAVLTSYIPDIQQDVIEPLLRAGHAIEDIRRLSGMLDHLQTG